MNSQALLTFVSTILFMLVYTNIQASERPNIIYILADDLGYGDLGCYGQKIIKTPHLDAMAGEGMKFMQHYSGSTVCAPARSCLLTGLHTGHTYMRGNGKNVSLREDPQDLVLPRVLKEAGYHTAMIGKSGLSCSSSAPSFPNRKGFDHFFGFISHTDAHHFYPPHLWRNGKKVIYAGNTLHEGPNYSSTEIIKETLSYLEERSFEDKPFFLHVAFQLPHISLRAPEEFKKQYRGKFPEAENVKIDQHWSQEKEPKVTYAAMVSYMDHNVGLILTKLKALNMDENTLVIFSSDNGAEKWGGADPAYFNSNGKLRGLKRDLYEGGIRVPMIARWPGKIKKSQISNHLSAFWDFLPTACEIAGIKAPITDGISYLPALLQKKQPEHDSLYWEFHQRGGKAAIRHKQWKLVLTNLFHGESKTELFNLAKDLSEKVDLSSTHPELVKKLKDKMRSQRVNNDIFKLTIPR